MGSNKAINEIHNFLILVTQYCYAIQFNECNSHLQVSEKLFELSELEQLVHSLSEIGGEFQRQFC